MLYNFSAKQVPSLFLLGNLLDIPIIQYNFKHDYDSESKINFERCINFYLITNSNSQYYFCAE